jgi:hypothetical protein
VTRRSKQPDRHPASYRDPSGFVFRRDGILYRQINRRFAADWDAFGASGLYDDLVAHRLLIPHEPVSAGLAESSDALAVIKPIPVPLITYAYEWSFSQLRDAALATLEAQDRALARGMILRDASSDNVQFVDGRPILIDSLSFEALDAARPWIGYRQFCQHFVAPLALMAYRDQRLALLMRDFPDGIPLDLASALLPGRTRLNPGIAAHLHLHARAQRVAGQGQSRKSRATPHMGLTRHRALVDHLRRVISGLKARDKPTPWSGYTLRTSYSEEAAASKAAIARELFGRVEPGVLWDIGANDGAFSAIAAECGHRVVALDTDPLAVDRHYLNLRAAQDHRVLPIVGDIAAPSPATGWALQERASLLSRCNADVIVALALIHHVVIARNVPLGHFSQLLACLAPHVILEFVPKDDPQVEAMLRDRLDIFHDYHLDGLLRALAADFVVVEQRPISGSRRTLLVLRRSSTSVD